MFLAGLEYPESSYDRASIVTRAAPAGKSILVLDSGHDHLDLRHAAWDEAAKFYDIRGSLPVTNAGSISILTELLGHVIRNHNANVTEEEAYVSAASDRQHAISQTGDAYYGYGYECEPFEEQAIGAMSLKQLDSEWATTMNLTCKDVRAAEDWYCTQVSHFIQVLLSSSKVEFYRRDRSYYDSRGTPEEKEADRQDIVASVAPPDHIGSWFHKIDRLIIMDDASILELLNSAALKVIGWQDSCVTDMCILGYSIAAHGAALRAKERMVRF